MALDSSFVVRITASKFFLLKILEAHMDLVGEDEFGQVSGGHLRVRGQLIAIEIRNPGAIFVDGKPTGLIFRCDDHRSLAGTPLRFHCLPIYIGHSSTAGYATYSTLVLERVEQSESFRHVGWLGRGVLSYSTLATDPLLLSIGRVQLDAAGVLVGMVQDESLMREITIL